MESDCCQVYNKKDTIIKFNSSESYIYWEYVTYLYVCVQFPSAEVP